MIRIKVPYSLEDYADVGSVPDLPPRILSWIEKAESITAEVNSKHTVEDRHSVIESNKSHWADEDLKEWLLGFSSDKCWYTEVKHGADYPEVEHFRPKKQAKDEDGNVVSDGYYWLAFNLTNYRLSKPMPNRKKGTFFPIRNRQQRALTHNDCHLDERPWFLDPLSPKDHLFLTFNDNGKAVPEEKISHFQKQRVQFTVNRFGLNHGLLNRRRREVWKNCRLLFYRFLNLSLHAEKTGSVAAEAKAEGALEKILDLIKPSAEFSSTAKSALKSTGDPIAIGIASSAS